MTLHEASRILVLGPCGAGKSTLAARLGEILRLPVIHLDSEYWRPGWQETPPDPWNARVQELVARDAWIMDGNYHSTLDLRLLRAQAVLMLDFPLRVYLVRVIRRVLMYRGRTRPDMAPGCPERLNLEFLHYVLTFHRGPRTRTLAALEPHRDHLNIVTLRHPAEADAWLASLRMERNSGD